MPIVPVVSHRDNGLVSPCFEGIPQELKCRPCWVVWRGEVREGKLKKPPFSPTSGRPASVSDRTTWGTYPQAVESYRRGGYDGVGIMLGYVAETPGFVMGLPLSGLDLDACIDPGSRQLTPEANDILVAMNSYAEVSPSGTGVKAFAFGRWKAGPRRARGVEIYGEERFFTVTGRHLPKTPFAVNHRQTALEFVQAHLFTGVRS